jgi:hypothetical protein
MVLMTTQRKHDRAIAVLEVEAKMLEAHAEKLSICLCMAPRRKGPRLPLCSGLSFCGHFLKYPQDSKSVTEYAAFLA